MNMRPWGPGHQVIATGSHRSFRLYRGIDRKCIWRHHGNNTFRPWGDVFSYFHCDWVSTWTFYSWKLSYCIETATNFPGGTEKSNEWISTEIESNFEWYSMYISNGFLKEKTRLNSSESLQYPQGVFFIVVDRSNTVSTPQISALTYPAAFNE